MNAKNYFSSTKMLNIPFFKSSTVALCASLLISCGGGDDGGGNGGGTQGTLNIVPSTVSVTNDDSMKVPDQPLDGADDDSETTIPSDNPLIVNFIDPNDGTYVSNQRIIMGERGGTVLPASLPVDINQYAGKWYEQGSVKIYSLVVLVNVQAVYIPQPNGSITVKNSGKAGGPRGREWRITGSAVPLNAANTRLSVSFFNWRPPRREPGNYWILDYAPDYSWAIVSNASGTSGTILTREQVIPEAEYNALVARAYQLGVRGTITPTAQYP